MSEDDTKRGREPRLRDFARRLLADDEDGGISPREVLGAVIDGGDKAKTELVRMVARRSGPTSRGSDFMKTCDT